MVKGGLAVPWAIMMSLLVYAGSAQLAALPLIVAGAPLWVIVATGPHHQPALRHLQRRAAPVLRRTSRWRKRAALGFFMTDFTFTLFMRRAQEGTLPERHRDAWFAGVCANNWITWQVCAITGIVAASYVPTRLGPRIHRHAGAGGAGGPEPRTRGPRWWARWSPAWSRCWRIGLPFKLGLFCGAIAGIVAATLADSWQQRSPPRSRSSRMNDPVSGIALGVVIVGLALSTFVTRTSFLLAGARVRAESPRRSGAALRAGVHAGGHHRSRRAHARPRHRSILSLLNPRLIGVLASALWLCWSRNILGCLALGMAAYSLARLFL